jgi:hypothetical protein
MRPLQEQHHHHQHHRNGRQRALQPRVGADLGHRGLVGQHRQQRHLVAEHHGHREVAHHQREDQQCTGQHRRQHHRQQHAQPGLQRAAAQALGRLFQLHVEAADGRQRADVDVGVVGEAHHRHQPGPAIEAGQLDAHAGQRARQQAVVADHHQPGLRGNHLGHHQRHQRQDGHDGLARVVVPGGEPGQRHTDQQRRSGDDRTQQHGVQHRGVDLGVAGHHRPARFAAPPQAAQQHLRQRPQQKDAQQRQQRRGQPEPGRAQVRTADHGASTRVVAGSSCRPTRSPGAWASCAGPCRSTCSRGPWSICTR